MARLFVKGEGESRDVDIAFEGQEDIVSHDLWSATERCQMDESVAATLGKDDRLTNGRAGKATNAVGQIRWLACRTTVL